jgi:hypothetical protein
MDDGKWKFQMWVDTRSSGEWLKHGAVSRVFSQSSQKQVAYEHAIKKFDDLTTSIMPSWSLRIVPAVRKSVKRKSLDVTFARSLQGNPLTRGALDDRSATQKSCNGSGSAACTITVPATNAMHTNATIVCQAWRDPTPERML